MSKTFEKAVTGFNHNVKYKGTIYHVQTEDSGVNNPHIITHLFVGGNILASKKTSYADVVGAENLQQVVRQLMEEQHKEMLRNLINGTYDHLDSTSPAYQPGQLAVEAHDSSPTASPPPMPPVVATPPPAAAQAAPRPVSPPPPRPPAAPVAQKRTETPVGTLFGEDLISEKSLDEVILSYLARESDHS